MWRDPGREVENGIKKKTRPKILPEHRMLDSLCSEEMEKQIYKDFESKETSSSDGGFWVLIT